MQGRALTGAQKALILDRVFAAWSKCDKLRLGQFIVCALTETGESRGDLFNIEDEDLAKALARFAESRRD